MSDIARQLAAIREIIHVAEREHGRLPGSVTLLAVSKSRSSAEIRAAAACGQMDFGENYVQEAVAKMDGAGQGGLRWHFIGPVQSNKTRIIAERFDWVHSLDRMKIAQRLSEARPADLSPLNVCIQINVSGETTKSGISLAQAPELVREIAGLPGLRLRGLMTMPAPAQTLEAQRPPFRMLRKCLEQLRGTGLNLDTLSMGTTHDLEAAVAEGATIVRIGTGIFGPRPG